MRLLAQVDHPRYVQPDRRLLHLTPFQAGALPHVFAPHLPCFCVTSPYVPVGLTPLIDERFASPFEWEEERRCPGASEYTQCFRHLASC